MRAHDDRPVPAVRDHEPRFPQQRGVGRMRHDDDGGGYRERRFSQSGPQRHHHARAHGRERFDDAPEELLVMLVRGAQTDEDDRPYSAARRFAHRPGGIGELGPGVLDVASPRRGVKVESGAREHEDTPRATDLVEWMRDRAEPDAGARAVERRLARPPDEQVTEPSNHSSRNRPSAPRAGRRPSAAGGWPGAGRKEVIGMSAAHGLPEASAPTSPPNSIASTTTRSIASLSHADKTSFANSPAGWKACRSRARAKAPRE